MPRIYINIYIFTIQSHNRPLPISVRPFFYPPAMSSHSSSIMVGELNISLVGDKLFLGGYGNYLPAEPLTLERQIESFRYILCAIYACFLWEHIVTFPIEIGRWKQLILKRQIVSVNFCVLISRYISWTNAIASAVFFFANPVSCQATFTWIFLSYALIWALTAIIFIIRVQSLYPGNRFIRLSIWLAFGIVCTMWIVSLGFFYSARLPPQYRSPRNPECTAAPSPYVHVIGFGGSMCFDVLILALTVFSATKNFANRKSRHGVLSAQIWVLETAIIYALVCFACNSSTFFVWIFQKNVLLRAYTIPFAIAVNPIVASRIVFHGATWGSKTVLLESRLVKITEEDVANWQRDPGVVGARRPSHTHIALPSRGNRYAKPHPSQMNRFNDPTLEMKDERLGLEGIFGNKAESNHITEAGKVLESESDSEFEGTFRKPFAGIIMPEKAAEKKERPISSLQSDASSAAVETIAQLDSKSYRRQNGGGGTLSYDEKEGTVSPLSSSSVNILPSRRASEANTFATAGRTSYDVTQDSIPAGWTVQEMIIDDPIPVSRPNESQSRTFDLESQMQNNDNAQTHNDNHVTISQHVTTHVD